MSENIQVDNHESEIEYIETKNKVSEAFSKAWGTIETPKHNKKVTVKTKKGYSYTFEYTDLTGIFDAIKPSFVKNGLSVTQDVKSILDGGSLFLSVTTRIVHSSGQFFESSPMIVHPNESIQDMGGQVTYLKRYSLSAMLGISTEQDDDANASLGNEATFDDKPETPSKASTKQLDFVDSLLKKNVSDKFTKEQLYQVLLKKMNTTVEMKDWTPSQASQAIKVLQGDK